MTTLPSEHYTVTVKYSDNLPEEPVTIQYTVTLQIPRELTVAFGFGKTPARLEKYFTKIAAAAYIFMRRNIHYGDAIRLGGVRGAVYELIGIFGRIWNIAIRSEVPTESNGNVKGMLSDLFTDGINYLCIAQMMLDEGNFQGRFLEDG